MLSCYLSQLIRKEYLIHPKQLLHCLGAKCVALSIVDACHCDRKYIM